MVIDATQLGQVQLANRLKQRAATRGTAIAEELRKNNPAIQRFTAYSQPPQGCTWQILETYLVPAYRSALKSKRLGRVDYVLPASLQSVARQAVFKEFPPAFYIAVRNGLDGMVFHNNTLALYDSRCHAIYAVAFGPKSVFKHKPAWREGAIVFLSSDNTPQTLTLLNPKRSPFEGFGPTSMFNHLAQLAKDHK